MKGITTLLVLSNGPVQQDIRAMLDGTEDFEVVGDAAKAAEAVVLMASKSPDLILIDAETHDMKDLETIRLLMDRGYTGSIVTIGCEIDQLEEAIQLGVMGYVTKDESASEILAVMRGVAQGDFAFGPSVMRTTQGDGASPRIH